MREDRLIGDVATTKLSRRSFVVGSSLLACGVVFAVGGCGDRKAFSGAIATGPHRQLNTWASFYENGTIEITSPCIELGQGAMTALALFVAEELDADWEKVHVASAPHNDRLYGNPYFWNLQLTAGSRTLVGYQDVMRVGGAQARHLLLRAAERKWKVPFGELATENGKVRHHGTDREILYEELYADVVVPKALPDFVEPDYRPQLDEHYFGAPPSSIVAPGPEKAGALQLKSRSNFRLIGKDKPRVDIPSKSRGAARFGIDENQEGMLYAMVVTGLKAGAAPGKIDDQDVRRIPGIVDVIALPHGVGIVGKDIFAVREAREKLQVSWLDRATFPDYDSTKTLDEFAQIARSGRDCVRTFTKGDAKDTLASLAGSAVKISFECRSELVYHAPMEPQSAVVAIAPDRQSAEAWVGTQYPKADAEAIAKATGIPAERVVIHPLQTGGAFGRRAEPGAVVDAALLSHRLGRPVKVIWTREDDLKRNPHRAAMVCRADAVLDDAGRIHATRHRVVSDSWVARTDPSLFESFGGNDRANWVGAIHGYDVPHHLVEVSTQRRAIDVCYLRGIGAQQNKFCEESLIDKIAIERSLDPLEFRLGMLGDSPRGQAVLREVARMADWGKPRKDRALGLAYTPFSNAHSALVVELSLNRNSGEIVVHKVWSAVDVGLPVQPGGVAAQIEGAILQALSITLKERITVEASVVQQSNFHDYPILRMNEIPEVEIKVMSTDNPICGAAELGMLQIAPAINSAFARLTGKHLTTLPMLPEAVLKLLGNA